VSARALVQDSGAPAWLSTAARDPGLIAPLRSARIALWNPPTSSSLADENRVCSLHAHCSLRSLRLASASRCLPYSLADEKHVCSLARPVQRRASLAQRGGAIRVGAHFLDGAVSASLTTPGDERKQR
jgi:hypothetical protein